MPHMTTPDRYLQLLHEYWGYDNFRGIQRNIIDSIGNRQDTLGLMPTGGGKSLTFQVPALAQEGVCLVITPLIALMKDQVDHLRRIGIQASAIYTGMSHSEIVTTLDNAVYGGIKLLYVSPERLSSDLFKIKLSHMKVSFITVDEAHCISQWGYDFRPSYLHIAAIRKLLPHAPVLALTATATPQVVDDIQHQLAFARPNVFHMSFERKNLAYIVRKTPDKTGQLVHILQSVKGSAIVYVRSRKRTKEIAKLLNDQYHITATFYHAGLDTAVKDQRQTDWQTDKVRVIVATNAFGMGIDKPDVRLVIHIDTPDSLEAYFQEAGRAGRDGAKSYAVLLYDARDKVKLQRRIDDNFPPKTFIAQVYEHLAYYYQVGLGSGNGYLFEFDIDKFCITFRHFPVRVDAALKLLEKAGYIRYETDPDNRARLRFLLERHELYRLDNLSPLEERAITALLRCYGSLFVDYEFINENLVAQEAAIEKPQLYLILQSLTRRHILHFIPQRHIPLVGYIQPREAIERLVIPSAVYEERKAIYTQRINAMIDYTADDRTCRSTQLLRYFGEIRNTDCQQCDVCLSQREAPNAHARHTQATQRILQWLADGQPHSIAELSTLHLPTHILNDALHHLLAEQKITTDGRSLSC